MSQETSINGVLEFVQKMGTKDRDIEVEGSVKETHKH